MDAKYNKIGVNYSVSRCTDPKIAKQLYAELRDATKIVNIGAGTGSYEPEGVELVAVEPSLEMISQRKKGAHKVEQSFAENLSFENNSFSHAMTVLSMHHWEDRDSAFREINRVTTDKFVAVSWDPNSAPFWLTRDYFPEIYKADLRIFPKLNELEKYFDEVEMKPLLIPDDCKDGFLAAFWKRPEAYLNEQVRQSISAFSNLDNVSEGLEKLTQDLSNGKWKKNNSAILNASFLDVGYKLITAKKRNSERI
ncbi:class I SAM-dependent methyltransferase [Aurantivibrio infirmus]